MARKSAVPKIKHIIPEGLSEENIINKVNELLIELSIKNTSCVKEDSK